MAYNRSELLMAYRWPAAVLISSVVLSGSALVIAWMAIRVLSQPIPIRIQGGLDVDRLVMPATLTIRADKPLPVQGMVGVKDQVQIAGEAPLTIRGPITVREISEPVQVSGAVDSRVASGETGIAVELKSPVDVDGSVVVKDTVTVRGDVDVDVEGKVNVEGKVGADVKPQLLPLR